MTKAEELVAGTGQLRVKTELEKKRDAAGAKSPVSDGGDNAKEAHKQAVKFMREEERVGLEQFGTSDLALPVIGDEKAEKKVSIKLLYDWWDGQGIRHPLGTVVDAPVNDAMRLLDERKAERMDPLKTTDEYEKL